MSDPLIGKQLGDYTIQGLLGRGGMARVYKGYDDRLQRFAAVKVINTDFTAADQAEYTERFRREARAIARLQHPNIVSIYQFGEHDGNHYMAMAFLDGKDLRQILKEYAEKGTLMPLTDVLSVVREVSSALDYAHNRGVIHRDIKPSNIMIDTEKRAVLTDFGLALTMSEGTLGDTFGSAHYIAPEQAVSSAKAVPQSDLYSLGVCLYEILAGKVPFDDPSAMSVALKHLNESPPPPRQFNPTITQPIERVVLKILDKDPLQRYRTGAELTQALEAAIKAEADEEATVKLPASKPETKKSEVATEPPAKPKSRAKTAKPDKPEQAAAADKPANGDRAVKADKAEVPTKAAPQPAPAGEEDILSALAQKNVKEVRASPSSTSPVAPAGSGSGGASIPAPAPASVDSAPSGPRTREFPPAHLEKNAQQVAQAHGAQPPSIASPGGPLAGTAPATAAAQPAEAANPRNLVPVLLLVGALLVIGLGAAYFGGVFTPNAGSMTPTGQAVALGTTSATAATSDGTSAVAPATGPATDQVPDQSTDPATVPATAATTGRATSTIRVTPTRATATPTNTPTPRVTRTPAITNTTASASTSDANGGTPTASTTDSGTPDATASQTDGTAVANATSSGGADIALFYDPDQLVLVNVSGRTLKISDVVFVQRGPETGQDLLFETTQWRQQQASASPDSLPAGSCFQVFRSGIVLPELLQNCRRGAWTPATKQRWFWVAQDASVRTFEVLIGDRKVATCEITAGRCDFSLGQ
jgi:serine/threonine protein kinase